MPSVACDLAAPRFHPSQATPDSSHPKRTRVPKAIGVELSGFATPADAARCFGERYHRHRHAEHVTVIVRDEDGSWGYLTPGKGGRNVATVDIASLMAAYLETGFSLHALAHTHPFGSPHFSKQDVGQMLQLERGEFYMTNWRNETYRMTREMLDASRRGTGFEGERLR
ncbi:JAB domain-containing protein [Lysobacter sp. 2RAF19]